MYGNADKSGLIGLVLTEIQAFRESSFNMTKGGNEDIEGGLRKFLDTQEGGSEKIRGGS